MNVMQAFYMQVTFFNMKKYFLVSLQGLYKKYHPRPVQEKFKFWNEHNFFGFQRRDFISPKMYKNFQNFLKLKKYISIPKNPNIFVCSNKNCPANLVQLFLQKLFNNSIYKINTLCGCGKYLLLWQWMVVCGQILSLRAIGGKKKLLNIPILAPPSLG